MRREVAVQRRKPLQAAIESKIAGYRAALADVQPLTNRRTKFVVLAFESSGWTDLTVQKLCGSSGLR